MKFVENIEYRRFDDFVKKHPSKSHFMQSSAWGEFNKVERGVTVHRIGLEDEKSGELAAAALIFERKPAAVLPPYLYCPRGFVCDYSNDELLKQMTEAVRKFAQGRKAMFLAMDPDIERREVDENMEYVEGGFDNSSLVDKMKSLGYIHRGWTLGFEGREPRFTYRIDLTRDQKTIDKSFRGNILKNVKKSHNFAVTVREGGSSDIPLLFEMLTKTSERDNYYIFPMSYYQNFYDCLAKDGMAHLYLGSVNAAETVKMLEKQLNDIHAKIERLMQVNKPGPLKEAQETEARLNKDIAKFTKYAEEFPGDTVISAHLVVRYGNKAWAMHAGSSGAMNESFCNNRVYYEKLMDQKNHGCISLDMGGTVGNAKDNENFRTVHEFKQQWSGKPYEFIGEFDMVLRPFWFFLYEKMRPEYHKLRFAVKKYLREKKEQKKDA